MAQIKRAVSSFSTRKQFSLYRAGFSPCPSHSLYGVIPIMQTRYWVYIMSSKSGTLYTGVTNSLDRRVFEHKHHLIAGFTAKYDCIRLVWFEEHSDVRNAIAREKQIKGWLRAKKVLLIESLNPHRIDLAKNWGAQLCPKTV